MGGGFLSSLNINQNIFVWVSSIFQFRHNEVSLLSATRKQLIRNRTHFIVALRTFPSNVLYFAEGDACDFATSILGCVFNRNHVIRLLSSECKLPFKLRLL